MPLFYFDLHGGGQSSVRDQEGTEFETRLDAQAHAMTLLPVMGVEMPLREGEFRTWTATVRDEGGDTVCRFILAIINDQVGPAGVRRLQAAARD